MHTHSHAWWLPRRCGIGAVLRVLGATLTVVLATYAVAVVASHVAGAATDTVTNCSGSVSVSGSLPFEVANAVSGDTVDFSSPPPCQSITLSSTIAISTDISIEGPGATVLGVNGNGSTEVFNVASGVTASITALGIGNGVNSGGNGGAIDNQGTLTVLDAVLDNNHAGTSGGAVFNAPGATLNLTDSTASSNYASDGGGVFNSATATVNITDSTLSNNSASSGSGGAVDNQGVLAVTSSTLSGDVAGSGSGGGIESNNATLTVSNSTIAREAASGNGGGIDLEGGTATVTNTTLSGNQAASGGGIEDNLGALTMGATIVAGSGTLGGDCNGVAGTVTDLGYNLDDDGSCGLTAAIDVSDTSSADLDPMGVQSHGGPTQTIALETGSTAIDAVSASSGLCPPTDQRGADRTGPSCDIGAYDTDVAPFVTLSVWGSQIQGGGGATVQYTSSAPAGIVTGTLVCTTVDNGTPISPGLPTGTYTIDGSSCSGLSSSDQTDYPVVPSSYVGSVGGYAVSAWGITPSPNQGGGDNELSDVTCTSATTCVTVGYYEAGPAEQTLIETLSGGTWVASPAPDTNTGDNELNAVSCTSPTSCVAVGYDDNVGNDTQETGVPQSLIETLSGTTWNVTTHPPDPNNVDTLVELNSVSCTGPSSCVAVGFDGFDTLIETLTATGWHITPGAAIPNNAGASLHSVSCITSTKCVAVGEYNVVTGTQTLVESWNGGSWSRVTSPNPTIPPNHNMVAHILDSVSCTSATQCMAVGINWDTTRFVQDSAQSLVESWNGHVWTIVTHPEPTISDQLLGVSCAGPTSCTAVGEGRTQTLIESWDGTAWSAVTSPNAGGSTPNSLNVPNNLFAVSCTGRTTCEAVGYDDAGTAQTLIENLTPPPVVTSLGSSSGFTTGGTPITITGAGFTGASAVAFGTVPATINAVTGDTSITVTVPPQSAGHVFVTVTGPGGTSSATSATQYTYTLFQTTPQTETCSTTCPTNTETTPLNDTTVSVAGPPSPPSGATTSLLVNTDTLSCGTSYAYTTAVSTLSTSGFSDSDTLTVTETVGHEPSTTGVGVCFATGSSTHGALLHICNSSMMAPCLVSLTTDASGDVVATFLSPSNDPRFWTGGAAPLVKKFSPLKGAPDSTVTIKGKNLSGVTGVVIGGSQASVKTAASTNSKLVVTVPSDAVTGAIIVTSDAGLVLASKTFTVT